MSLASNAVLAEASAALIAIANPGTNSIERSLLADSRQFARGYGVQTMQRSKLLASTAIALLMCSVPALAQQKSDDKAGAAQTQGSETKEQERIAKGH